MYVNLTQPELDQLTDAYLDTSAVQRLADGYVGAVRHTLAPTFIPALRTASRAMLDTCTGFSGLARQFRNHSVWRVPLLDKLPDCRRKLHLIVLDGMPIHVKQASSTVTPSSTSGYSNIYQDVRGSLRMRGVALAGQLLHNGHMVSWYSAVQHKALFEGCQAPGYRLPFADDTPPGALVLAMVIKYMPDGAQLKVESLLPCFQHHKIPVVMDLIDSPLEFTQLHNYSLILATSRIASLIFEANARVPSRTVYHQPANYANFHRVNRTTPVTVVAMIHEYQHHGYSNKAVAEAVAGYCQERNMTFRLGDYGGHGFSQEEMRTYILQGQNPGNQLGYAMGYSSVDIAIVWLPCNVPELLCVKPTTRLAAAMSLGIPTIFIGSAAYLDIAVEYGYPLVASSPEEVVALLQLLTQDAALRQAVSELGLRVAKRFHLRAIAKDLERTLCTLG